MRTGLWEFTLEKITNPELKNYPSLALLPFNYSLSTNLSFPEFTHFSPPFLMRLSAIVSASFTWAWYLSLQTKLAGATVELQM